MPLTNRDCGADHLRTSNGRRNRYELTIVNGARDIDGPPAQALTTRLKSARWNGIRAEADGPGSDCGVPTSYWPLEMADGERQVLEDPGRAHREPLTFVPPFQHGVGLDDADLDGGRPRRRCDRVRVCQQHGAVSPMPERGHDGQPLHVNHPRAGPGPKGHRPNGSAGDHQREDPIAAFPGFAKTIERQERGVCRYPFLLSGPVGGMSLVHR